MQLRNYQTLKFEFTTSHYGGRYPDPFVWNSDRMMNLKPLTVDLSVIRCKVFHAQHFQNYKTCFISTVNHLFRRARAHVSFLILTNSFMTFDMTNRTNALQTDHQLFRLMTSEPQQRERKAPNSKSIIFDMSNSTNALQSDKQLFGSMTSNQTYRVE